MITFSPHSWRVACHIGPCAAHALPSSHHRLLLHPQSHHLQGERVRRESEGTGGKTLARHLSTPRYKEEGWSLIAWLSQHTVSLTSNNALFMSCSINCSSEMYRQQNACVNVPTTPIMHIDHTHCCQCTDHTHTCISRAHDDVIFYCAGRRKSV